MPSDPMYVPMLCGAAVWKPEYEGQKAPDYLKDNIGDNISSRNPNFCELTGLYWAWKHMDADYIGLVHYRRYFRGSGRVRHSGIRGDIYDQILTQEELLPMLETAKVFVPSKRHYVIETLYSHYEHSHYKDHLDRTRVILVTRYPEYVSAFDEVMQERSAHMFNMLILERGLLDEYCTWLFDILMILEQQVDTAEYTYFQARYAGRVGELIFNVWLRHQIQSGRLSGNEVKTLPFLYVEHTNWYRKIGRFLKAKFLHTKYEAV